MHFNKGWGYHQDFVVINKKDKQLKNKIKTIVNYLSNVDLPKQLKGVGIKEHEIYVNEPIILDKYLIGVICYCTDELFKKIKKILIRAGYDDINIFRSNVPPEFDELISF